MKCLDFAKIRFMFVVFVAAIVLSGLTKAATITVGQGASYDYDSIQAGIDAANDTDTVLVAPGEYVITEPITFRGKAIMVKSEAGQDETTIRMGTPADPDRGSVVVFENGETIASVLDGFTITGGSGSRPEDALLGGGICFYASSGTVRNCAIVLNTAEHGGGLLCWDNALVTVTSCTITENSAAAGFGGGGGVYCGINSSATMTDCAITGNSSKDSGGGVLCYLDSSLTMTDCVIAGNSGGNLGAANSGGGVMCYLGSSSTLTDCTIAENSVRNSGGGVCNWDNSPMTLTNCTIVQNSCDDDGAGLCSGVNSPTTVINCTISGNSAGTDAGGMGCYDRMSAKVINSIFWGNTAATGIGDEIYLGWDPTEFSITYSNVAGGKAGVYVQSGHTLNWGVGNIDVDPFFADPNNHDFHVKSEAGRWDPNNQTWVQDDVTSPCIDAGDPLSPVMYEPHPRGCIINMGAYGGTEEASKSPFGCSYEADSE